MGVTMPEHLASTVMSLDDSKDSSLTDHPQRQASWVIAIAEWRFGAKALLCNGIDVEAETMWNGDTRLWSGCPQCEPAMQAAKPTTLP